MNIDLILMLGALVLLAISGLLVFCFTESRGKNTPYARRHSHDSNEKTKVIKISKSERSENLGMKKELV